MGTSELDLSPPYVVLGPACDQPTYFTASLSSRYLKDIQISYSATTPLLSDTNRFPLFYRTVPSYSDYSRAIFALMRHFDWLRVGVVHQEDSHYTRSLEDLNLFLTSSSANSSRGQASVILSQALNSFLTRSVELSSNARIFIVMAPENMAANIICAAYQRGLTGSMYQWILLGDNFYEDWWKPKDGGEEMGNLRCTAQEMLQAVKSVIILTHNPKLASGEELPLNVDFENQTVNFWQDFADLVSTTTGEPFRPHLSTRAAQAYDAVWSLAYALEGVFTNHTAYSSRKYDYLATRSRAISTFTKQLNEALERLDFQGISGRIHFNSLSHSAEQPLTYILQMQEGHIVPIGIHDQREGAGLNSSFYGNDFVWQDELPPRDRPKVVDVHVPLSLYITMTSLAILGIVCTIIIAVVNCVYRKHKVIKASSPYLNIVLLIGCVLWLISVPLSDIESLKIITDTSILLYICYTKSWCTNIGLTLVLGTIFFKTWRIYVVFRNPWSTKHPYKDHVLLGMVMLLLAYEVVILLIWAVPSPLQFIVYVDVRVDFDSFIEQRSSYCTSQFTPGSNTSLKIHLALLSAPNLLLLVLGSFLVLHTKHIKSKYFRDAKLVGLTIIMFMVSYGILAPLSLLGKFSFEPYLDYLGFTMTILIIAYTVLATTFVPKFVLLKEYKKKVPSAVLLGLNPSYRSWGKFKTKMSQCGSNSTAASPSLWNEEKAKTEWESAYEESNKPNMKKLKHVKTVGVLYPDVSAKKMIRRSTWHHEDQMIAATSESS